MKRTFIRFLSLLMLATTAATLSSCVVYDRQPYGYYHDGWHDRDHDHDRWHDHDHWR